MKCEHCKFWSHALSSMSTVKYQPGVGECRRHAPRGPVALAWMEGVEIRNQAIMSAFPPMASDDWCGEFVVRDQTGEQAA